MTTERKRIVVKSKNSPDMPSSEVGQSVAAKNLSRMTAIDSNMLNFYFAVGLTVLSFILTVTIFFWTPDQYDIPTTDDYRLLKLTPLNQKGDISDADARNFVAKSLKETLTISNISPKSDLNESLTNYFTKTGRSDFVRNLDQNGDLSPLTSGVYDTQVQILSVPVIEDYRLTNGRFTWVYSTHIKWIWTNTVTGEVGKTELKPTVFVVRESALVKSARMAINAIVLGNS